MALGAALAYGAADFLGGLAARRSAVIPAILVSQSVGLIAVVVAAPLLAPIPDATPLAWGLAAGAGYGVGLVFLYGSLAKGRMSVAAPISAVCALALPVVFALALGEVPSRWAIVGILLAVGSIVLVSQDGSDATRVSTTTKAERSRQGPNIIAMALAGGVGFGLFSTCLARPRQVPGSGRSSHVERWSCSARSSLPCGRAASCGSRGPRSGRRSAAERWTWRARSIPALGPREPAEPVVHADLALPGQHRVARGGGAARTHPRSAGDRPWLRRSRHRVDHRGRVTRMSCDRTPRFIARTRPLGRTWQTPISWCVS